MSDDTKALVERLRAADAGWQSKADRWLQALAKARTSVEPDVERSLRATDAGMAAAAIESLVADVELWKATAASECERGNDEADRAHEAEQSRDAALEDVARLRTDLLKGEQIGTCERCRAMLFDSDDIVADPDGVTGCWYAMTDAPSKIDRPCYAYRVGAVEAGPAKVEK